MYHVDENECDSSGALAQIELVNLHSSSMDLPPRSPLRMVKSVTKRYHALHELLSSERAYASDLALIREVHIPLALGHYYYHYYLFFNNLFIIQVKFIIHPYHPQAQALHLVLYPQPQTLLSALQCLPKTPK